MGEFYDTLIDYWPPEIRALSIPTFCYEMDKSDVYALLSQHIETRSLLGLTQRRPFSPALIAWINQTLINFPKGAFIRLGICSFVTEAQGPKRVTSGEQVIKLLMHSGVRAASLAYRCYRARQPVSLCIRAWHEIEPWSEFRIFIKKRKVVAITQYHWRCYFPQIDQQAACIFNLLHKAATEIAKLVHLDNVVADICITNLEQASWLLIELNPYSSYTGAGLFQWNKEGDFDKAFRYLQPDEEKCFVEIPILD